MADLEQETDEPDKEDDQDLLAEAKENFKTAEAWWEANRKAWVEDAKFAAGEQWPENIKKLRSMPGEERPCLVVDKLNQYRRQVVNDARQNRPSIKVRPVADGAVEETAKGFQGLFRHILNRSNADEAFDTSIDHAATGGFGYFRILTEYAHENTFNQEICVKRIRNPLAVLLSPHDMADGSDCEFGFVIDEVPKKTFTKQYPDAKQTDWTSDAYKEGWATEESIRVCEYFYRVEEPRTLHLLADGTSIEDSDYQRAVAELGQDKVPPIEESRELPLYKVKWCKLTGAEVLEQQEWLGKYIPIIPVYGNESDVEGRVMYSGLIRAAKDAQRLYNYMRSAFAERVAYTPKAPWLAAAEQIADYEEWKTANTGSHQVLRYKARDEQGNELPPPQRISPADVPAGFAQDMQVSEHDIQAALGMYSASVGAPSNEKSGKAIMARQREGDTSTFQYHDNQNRAIRYLGRQLLDLAPKVYDSKRVARILHEDGTSQEVEFNPDQEAAYQQVGSKLIYNLNVGTYDVEVEAGPSYTTKRLEQADAMTQIATANPQVFSVIGDLWARAQDWPNADAVADRLHAMLPPPILQAEQDKAAGMSPEVAALKKQAQGALDQAQQRIQAAEQAIQQRDHAIDELQTQILSLRRQIVVKGAEVEVKNKQADTDAYDAETKRLTAIAPAFQLDTQGIAAVVQQAVQDALATHLTNAPPQGLEPSASGPPMQPPNVPPVAASAPPPGGV